MTIFDDHGDQAAEPRPPEIHTPAEVSGQKDDRRRTAGGPRLSWASGEPFLERERTAEDRVTGRDVSGWHATAAAYVRHALASDLVISAVVVLLVLFVTRTLDRPKAVWVVAVAVVFVLLIAAFGGYDHKSLGDGPEEFRSVLRASVGAVATVALASVALAVDMPRGVVAATVLAVVPAVVVGRYGLRQSLHSRRSRGEAMSRTLVVGDAESVHRIITDLRAATYHGYRIVGVCLPSIADQPPQDAAPTLGALADIPQVAYDHHIDVVIVTGSELAGEALRRLSWALGRSGTELVVAPGLVEVLGPRVQLRPTAGLTLLEVETSSPRSRMFVKALLDRTLAATILAAALPVLLLT